MYTQSYSQDRKLRKVLNDFCCHLSNQNPVLENAGLVIKNKKKEEICSFSLRDMKGLEEICGSVGPGGCFFLDSLIPLILEKPGSC